MSTTEVRPPSKKEILDARQMLGDRVRVTPILEWEGLEKEKLVGPDTQVVFKLELFQYGGSFKPRGALINMLALDPEALKRGVTAVSAGNHAIAVSVAARSLGSHAKVVMPASANPGRIKRCRELGTEVVLKPNVAEAFAETKRIEAEEGRTFVHPFEGPLTALGTATLGQEFAEQASDLDAMIIPIGGGGLAAGMASGIRSLLPHCRIYGVEPFGADTMFRSLAAGKPQGIDQVRTIADSLGSPFALPYSFELCRQLLERVVLITDHQMRHCMRLMLEDLKLAVEPAGASALAALLGPLYRELAGKRVGVLICGANIDPDTFCRYLSSV